MGVWFGKYVMVDVFVLGVFLSLLCVKFFELVIVCWYFEIMVDYDEEEKVLD